MKLKRFFKAIGSFSLISLTSYLLTSCDSGGDGSGDSGESGEETQYVDPLPSVDGRYIQLTGTYNRGGSGEFLRTYAWGSTGRVLFEIDEIIDDAFDRAQGDPNDKDRYTYSLVESGDDTFGQWIRQTTQGATTNIVLQFTSATEGTFGLSSFVDSENAEGTFVISDVVEP